MKCICHINVLMSQGCQCGQMQLERTQQEADEPIIIDHGKPHEMVINDQPINIYCLYGDDTDPREFTFDDDFKPGNDGVLEYTKLCMEKQKENPTYPHFQFGMEYEELKRDEDGKLVIVTHNKQMPIGWSSNPEFEKLEKDSRMEALLDRTIHIDIEELKKQIEQLEK